MLSRNISAVLTVALVTLLTLSASAQTVGEALPAWAPGYLDIHFINTGRMSFLGVFKVIWNGCLSAIAAQKLQCPGWHD